MLLRKLYFCGTKLATSFDFGDFDCINLTVKFWYWSCSDALPSCNNLVAVLKVLKADYLSQEILGVLWEKG